MTTSSGNQLSKYLAEKSSNSMPENYKSSLFEVIWIIEYCRTCRFLGDDSEVCSCRAEPG